MSGKSRILVIGGTGYIGKFIVEAAVMGCHPTSAIVRESTLSNPAKSEIVEGDFNDERSLEKAIEATDVVMSRFFPLEFGNDVDRTHAVEPVKSTYGTKTKIRRSIEAANIPYTCVSSNFFAGYFLNTLSQPGLKAPPRDKVNILGNGDPKAVFNKEEDIATYTIKAVDDHRNLNKILCIRPPQNVYSFSDIVSLWEKKIEASFSGNVVMSISHSVFVLGDQTNFEIEDSFGVEALELYPNVKYPTVDEYLDQFV